jgi:hypothetical protein
MRLESRYYAMLKHITLRCLRPSVSRLAAAGLALCCITALAVGARTLLESFDSPAVGSLASTPPIQAQGMALGSAPTHRKLSLNPEAAALSRRIGRRFKSAGREVSFVNGTLITGGDARHIRVTRVQDNVGERVEVALGGQIRLAWDAERGAVAEGQSAGGEELELVERIALDSAEQFVLAQLRGAVYHVVSRSVRLAKDDGADEYAGPLYDVVRVSEPPREGASDAVARWRLYYLNTRTGLVERVVSESGGGKVVAELSGWVEHAGEWSPSRIAWMLGGEPWMELTIQSVSHGPKR